MKFDLEGLMRGGETIVCDPAELGCHVGGGGSSSQQSAQQTSSGSSFGQSANQSLTLPQNFQNSQFTNLAPNIGTVQNLLSNPGGVGVTSTGNAQHPDINAWTVGNQGISSSSSQNPLVAQVTGAQNQTLGQIGQTVGQNSQTLSPGFNALQPELAGGNQFATSLAGGLPTNSAFNNLLSSGYAGAAAGGNPVNSTLASILDPNFASGLATSPQTQAAIQSALSPVRQQFNTQQVPGLEGSFTQAGQRVGSSSGMGSSAFQNAYANAQGTELSNEANIAGQISNQAYQTGLGMTNSAAQLLQGEGSNLYGQGLATSANAAQALQSAQGNLYGTGASIAANAPSQLASLSQTELNNLISGLNAQALPQLTQQYGITAGTQLYQQQVSTILQALGLGVQAAQPVLGYGSESTGGSQQASTSESQGTSQGSSHSSQFSLSNPFSFG